MPPSLNQVRPIDRFNTAYLQKKMQSTSIYIANKIYPVLPGETTGRFYKWGDEAFTGDATVHPAAERGVRQIGSAFARISPRSLSSDTYSTSEYGFQTELDDRLRKAADGGLRLEMTYNEMLMHETLRAQENRVKSVVTSTSSITNNTTLTGTDQWSDDDDSDPIGNINTGVQTVKVNTLFDPAMYDLVAVTNDQVWDTLRFHSQLVSKLATTRDQVVSQDSFNTFFGFTEVIVAEVFHNTANAGQTATLGRLWGDDFLIFARPKSPAAESVALGYTFAERDVESESWREEPRTTQYLVSHEVANKLIHAASGYLIKDCLA